MLISPLIAKGNLIGAIKVEDKIEQNGFNEKDKELLRLLSSQIAIALNNARLYEMAITDSMTKLYVHRHFQFKLNDEILQHKRNRSPLSLIMIDIDHFKNVNDTYGHQAGDYILKETARIIKSMFRATDFVFRYGGEEISIILPETNIDNAYVLAEKLRKNIENNKYYFQNNQIQITISNGISSYLALRENEMTKEQLVQKADEALYYSKNNGRNQTTLYQLQIGSQPMPESTDVYQAPIQVNL